MDKKGYGNIAIILGANGLTNTMNKLTISVIPPYLYLTLRYIGIVLISLLVDKGTSTGKSESTLKMDLKKIRGSKSLLLRVCLALLFSNTGAILYYQVFKYLPVSLISVLDNGVQLLVVSVLGVIIFKDKKTWFSWVMTGTTIGGLYLVVMGGKGILEVSFFGVTLLLINSIMVSMDTVITTTIVKEISATTVTTLRMFVSTFVMLAVSLIIGEKILDTLTNMTPYMVGLLVYSVVVGYIVKNMVTHSFKTIGASKTTLILSFIPVLSTIIAMFVFKEYLSVLQWVGVVVTVVSIVTVNRLSNSK